MADTLPLTGVQNFGEIGEGAFGKVYLVANHENEQFAVKVMKMTNVDRKRRELAWNEVDVLKQLYHEHVIIYVNMFEEQGLMYLITEYCAGGDLAAFLGQLYKRKLFLPEDLLKIWLLQIAKGLEYMHCHDPMILHRDLKPSNIYLTDFGDIRLGDMGVARIVDTPNMMLETFCGSPAYMSPEALFEQAYNKQTDIWSLGCCVVEMASQEKAFEGTISVLRCAVIQKRAAIPSTNYSPDLQALVTSMLNLRYEQRPHVTSIVENDYLADCWGQRPVTILQNYCLLDLISKRQRPSTLTCPKRTSTSTFHTTVNLDRDETVVKYREKRKSRESSNNEGTLTPEKTSVPLNREAFYTTQKLEKKTILKQPRTSLKKKAKEEEKTITPETVGGAAREAGRDVSLSQPLLASFASAVSEVQSKHFGCQADVAASQINLLELSDVPFMSQMDSLKTIMIAMLGEDMWDTSSQLITGGVPASELMEGLLQQLGSVDLCHSVIRVIIYCTVTDIARQPSPDPQ